jgi:membrane associated rhomboid family serine protease
VIPLRDINPTRSRPVVTYALIAANVAVFLYQFQLSRTPGAFDEFLLRWGFVPYFFAKEPHWGSIETPFTSMFMHGDFLHLISNMWFLHIFGDNIEDVLGRSRFILFYLLCGLVAAFAQLIVEPGSRVPMVGASGAIAGVLAAYLRLFPRARVLTLIPIFIVPFLRELPAVFFIVLWFVVQLISGIGSLGALGRGGGIAFFAHIGGFVAGLWLLALFGRRRKQASDARTFKSMPGRRRYESYRD